MPGVTQLKFKVTLLGDGAVGKTSLLRRFVLDQFSDDYVTTIGAKVTKKAVNLSPGDGTVVQTTMMLWDIPGQMDRKMNYFEALMKYKPQKQFFMGSKGAVVVCDITRKETLDNLTSWVKSLQDEVGHVPMVFMANKSDLGPSFAFTMDELAGVAGRYSAPTFATSAKSGSNVQAAFVKLAEMLYRNTA